MSSSSDVSPVESLRRSSRRSSRERRSSRSPGSRYSPRRSHHRRRRDRRRSDSEADFDPLAVSKSDNPGAQLIPLRLYGTNFFKWSQNVKMDLGAKTKLGFIDNSCPRPASNSRSLPRWVRADYMIRCWLLNSMEENPGQGC